MWVAIDFAEEVGVLDRASHKLAQGRLCRRMGGAVGNAAFELDDLGIYRSVGRVARAMNMGRPLG